MVEGPGLFEQSPPTVAIVRTEDVSKLYSDTLRALLDVAPNGGDSPRLFFPNGINSLQITITVGPKDAPIFSAELDINTAKTETTG